MAVHDSDWCILRTRGRHTLSLADSLANDGYEVWTPIETKTIQIPRANVKRTIRLPIMPSYVFARFSHLVDLLQLADMPVKPRRGSRRMDPAHADFSVLHAFGRIPLVADRHLTELRKLEARRTPAKMAKYALPPKSTARVKGGVFGGMIGLVVRSTPAATVLRFNGSFPVEIPTFLLEQDGVSAAPTAVLEAA
jgi:hypothetical protein